MRYKEFVIVKMFLESPDVFQVMGCGIGQEYNLHMIQVLGFVHHDKFVS